VADLSKVKSVVQSTIFGTGDRLEAMMKKLENSFQQKGGPIRAALDQKVNAVENIDELMDTYSDSVSIVNKVIWGILKVLGRTDQWKKMKGPSFAKLKNNVEDVFGKDSLVGTAFDHTKYQPSLVNIARLYQSLSTWVKLVEETTNIKKGNATTQGLYGNVGAPVPGQTKAVTHLFTIDGESIDLQITPLIKTLKQLVQLRKEVGATMLALKAVNSLPIKEPAKVGDPARGKSYNNALEDLAESVNQLADTYTEIDLLAEAEVITDVLNTGSEVKLRVVSADFNKWLATIETRLSGAGRNAAEKAGLATPGRSAALGKATQKHFLDKIDFSKVKWSKSQEDQIVDQISKIATGQKYKAVKKKPRKTTKLKTETITGKVQKTNVAQKIRKARAKQSKLMSTLNKPYSVKKEKRKESGSTDIAAMSKLETLINKRLPAEVRRNMGRPALRNQTGKFSNSVELQNLRPTAKGLTADYTYQLSPYETFENTGSRRWPSGYNPKPLITKSIRQLAFQYTEQKLVSLRRK
tara:strand:- start:141 stop:1712 length:1572 start_codon:yes stop_codon:yes gene_type:complete